MTTTKLTKIIKKLGLNENTGHQKDHIICRPKPNEVIYKCQNPNCKSKANPKYISKQSKLTIINGIYVG
jgi:hypothetical protein